MSTNASETAVTRERLLAALRKVRGDLLSERVAGAGHWVGELSTSALSTATAISALVLANGFRPGQHVDAPVDRPTSGEQLSGEPVSGEQLAERQADGARIERGVAWLAERQNADGGWGDTDRSVSNIATTMLVRAAFTLAGQTEKYAERMAAAVRYIDGKQGLVGLRRRYGRDKTFAVPILANSALAGLTPWSEVFPLPFELASFPQSWYRFLRMPVVSYAVPALVAIGQLRFFRRPPWNPLIRWFRQARVAASLAVLERMQPASGGYLEAIPLTSFVVMSLAGTGRASHPVAQRGLKFLRESVLADGSWPIDVNLATWLTGLATVGLATGDPAACEAAACEAAAEETATGEPATGEWAWADRVAGDSRWEACRDWLLECQNRDRHPFTGADPGGWGWTDLSGAVPDADDTPGALLALAAWRQGARLSPATRSRIDDAARLGISWLLGLQNDDGGWPTFCRGWGRLPFDRSGADLTAHALRALNAWEPFGICDSVMGRRVARAQRAGWNYLGNQQRADGAWIPLWFGNQHLEGEENPLYGTAKVVLAYCETGRTTDPRSRKGLKWLAAWVREALAKPEAIAVEEMSLAVEALASAAQPLAASSATGADKIHDFASRQEHLANPRNGGYEETVDRAALRSGLDWLIRAVETSTHSEPTPIGLYFAKLWYYEKLYPLVFAVAALGRASRASGVVSETVDSLVAEPAQITASPLDSRGAAVEHRASTPAVRVGT
ncbi:MAG: prenyltransferase/squalene oxidase repeat-containing protein [Planctomycetota bacterium]